MDLIANSKGVVISVNLLSSGCICCIIEVMLGLQNSVAFGESVPLRYFL